MIEQIKQALEESNLVRGVAGVPSAEKDEWLRYLLGEVERLKEIDERESLITINIRNRNMELQKENEALRRSLTTEAVKNSENARVNQELQKALEWYANSRNYEMFLVRGGHSSSSMMDSGDRARQALERTKS